MKTRLLLPAILLIFPVLLFTQCRKDKDNGYHFDFLFITENYKPLNYTENNALKGLAPDILREICLQLDIPFNVSVMQWDEGYMMAQENNNAVLFSTILNAERRDLFKWAGPIASLDWFFYASSPNSISLLFLDDAKEVGSIGVIKDYSIEQFLVNEGFTNLVYCADNMEAFDKLLKGEIDLFPSDRITAEAALETLNKSIYHVTEELLIRTDLVYFAFNKQIPDHVVADFQEGIDRLKDNGTLLNLYRKYLNSSDVPGKLVIYTEQYPPLTFRNNLGEISGFGTEILREIMNRNSLYENIRLSAWSNGYELALNNPNFCLFTMDRTALREDLFQWVGPIGTNTTYFYTKAGSGIIINSLDDARNLTSIGTVSSWFSDQYLRDLGFTNLVSDSDPNVLTEKLMQGEIDAFVCSSVTFPSILGELGYDYSQVVPSYALMSSDYYISFSRNTSLSTVDQWQATLDAMKLDGTYDAISDKWLP